MTLDNSNQAGYYAQQVNELLKGLQPPVVEPRKAKPRVKRVVIEGIELEDLRRLFKVPITEAADQLGIGVTALKKICRKFGVVRWPYRRVKAMHDAIRDVQEVEQLVRSHDDKTQIEEVKELAYQCANNVTMDPVRAYDPRVRRLTKTLKAACKAPDVNASADVAVAMDSGDSDCDIIGLGVGPGLGLEMMHFV